MAFGGNCSYGTGRCGKHHFQEDIAAADDPMETRKRLIEEYREKFSNPYVAASRGYVDDVIDPATTRIRLISALEMLASKRENRPAKSMEIFHYKYGCRVGRIL